MKIIVDDMKMWAHSRAADIDGEEVQPVRDRENPRLPKEVSHEGPETGADPPSRPARPTSIIQPRYPPSSATPEAASCLPRAERDLYFALPESESKDKNSALLEQVPRPSSHPARRASSTRLSV